MYPGGPARWLATALASVVIAVAAAVSGDRSHAAPAPPPTVRGGEIPGELIVRFEPGTSARERREARAGAEVQIERSMRLTRTQLLEVESGQTVVEAIRKLERDPNVAYAEPNRQVTASASADDPRFGELWGLLNTGQVVGGVAGVPGADIDAPTAWDTSTGSRDVLVAVVDTGLHREHEDLAANAWTNPGEAGSKASNGADDDGNGLVDDWRGWDFAYDDNNPSDLHSHGTHVGGTIGAVGGNGRGVAGVSQAVSLVGVKVLSDGGSGSWADVADGFVYAGKIGARVANASLGGSGLSQTVADSMRASPNTLFVLAAGNSSSDNDRYPSSPCAEPVENSICVAATDNRDRLAYFSSYGLRTVDLGAPGVNTLSTVPSGYGTKSGTSMATPHVAGGAALMFAVFPGDSPLQMKDRLLGGTEPVAALGTITVTGGRLDLPGALGHEPNLKPVARLSASPERPRAQERVTLDGSASSDEDGEVAAYEWDLDGNGVYERSTGSTPTVPHVFAAAGTHAVGLRVRDNRGAAGVAELRVTVDPAPADAPVARASYSPRPVYANVTTTLDGSASTDDGPIAAYAWDLDGDGTYDAESANATHEHRFAAAGSHPMGLRVRDADGKEAEQRFTVTVERARPRAAFSVDPPVPARNQVVRFDASASTDVDGQIRGWRWDLDGDGWYDTSGNAVVEHRYDTAGARIVKLEVTDNEGQTATATQTVDVQAGPALAAEGPTAFTERPGESDGDGAIEPGEGVRLGQALRNHGASAVTGLTGSLRSLVGDHVTPAEPGAWPDIGPGQAAAPTTQAAADIWGTAPCGTPLELELDIETDQGSKTLPVTIPATGARGPTHSREPAWWPQTVGPRSTLHISGGTLFDIPGRVRDLDVRVRDVRHPNIGDMVIAIEPPGDRPYDDMVTLISRRGGSGGAILDAVFDDDAEKHVSEASAPFTGRFRPEEPLSRLAGHRADGSWALYFANNSTTDSAVINAVGIDLTPAVCDTTHNASPKVELTASEWWPSVGYPVTFDASGSSDPDGRITAYRWDVDGDGAYERTTQEPTLTVSFDRVGHRQIGVLALDDRRGVGELRKDVYVTDNMHPRPSFSFDQPVRAGQPVRFDGTASRDADGEIVGWRWWVDQQLVSTDGPVLDHTFSQPGWKYVYLEVVDERGATWSVGANFYVEPQSTTDPEPDPEPDPVPDPDPEPGPDPDPEPDPDPDPDPEPDPNRDSGQPTSPFPTPVSPLFPPPPGGGSVVVEPAPNQPPPVGAPPSPVLTVSSPLKQRMPVLGRGMPVSAGCDAACSLIAKLTLGGKDARRLGLTKTGKAVQIARVKRVLTRAGRVKLRLKPRKSVLKPLLRRKSVKLTLAVTARGAGGTKRTVRAIQLRR